MEYISRTGLATRKLQERVADIYDNWQSIFDDPPDALNAQYCNGCSDADSYQEPQYSSEAAG